LIWSLIFCGRSVTVRFCAAGVGEDVTGGVTLVVAVVFLFAFSSEVQAPKTIAVIKTTTIRRKRFRLILIAIHDSFEE
jgi:hypothetical protein